MEEDLAKKAIVLGVKKKKRIFELSNKYINLLVFFISNIVNLKLNILGVKNTNDSFFFTL
jgi:hypothetical protein